MRVAHAEALAAAGDDDEARRATRAAIERLSLVDAQVDPAWKRGFRTIPEVEWTVRLARALGVDPGPLGDVPRA